ncbi:MAG: hypothetical protein GY797_32150 [Deltaproteobacteria bacterium]|nr:hypothetical protein [Deltaproteobacteria bacterium]
MDKAERWREALRLKSVFFEALNLTYRDAPQTGMTGNKQQVSKSGIYTVSHKYIPF